MGVSSLPSILMVTLSLFGLICLILIMLGSTRRLERAQDQRYGDLLEYQNYVQTVPVLFP